MQLRVVELAEGHTVEKAAKLIEKIKFQHVKIVGRASKIYREPLNLPANGIFLLSIVLKEVEVVENVTVLGVLELL